VALGQDEHIVLREHIVIKREQDIEARQVASDTAGNLSALRGRFGQREEFRA
jgi:hypothetical protein